MDKIEEGIIMKKIQMVDLQGQYQQIKPEIDLAISNVVNSAQFINGPDVKSFASELSEYLGGSFVIPCANGTDALQIAMMAAGLKPGDEVITASFTYVATAEVIALLHLTPVLVDVDPHTFSIDIDALRKAITSKTKAIVPVHLFGQCADMEKVMDVAKEFNLLVIEDTAQATGADYFFKNGEKKKAGTIGHIGTTSFFPSKNLGCYGDGGAIFTSDADLAEKIRMVANHGQKVQYVHDEIGVNSRLDTIQAAILRVKLPHLDEYSAARALVASFYDSELEEIEDLIIPSRASYSNHVFHQYTLQVKNGRRNELREFLKNHEIPSMIYYPLPLHKQKAFASERYKLGMFPVSEMLCEAVLSLPISTEMDEEQLNYISKTIKKFYQLDGE